VAGRVHTADPAFSLFGRQDLAAVALKALLASVLLGLAALQVLLAQRAGHHAVAGRRLARKDATITAAGATVAVIGTAAIVRQVRKRRRET